ncbi:hypothetical protein [Clostridium sp. SM-530-WT-3G]|nr:hypothetical protein [Clostridium sp. SM-530-WT-3G]
MEALKQLIADNKEIFLVLLVIYVLGIVFKIIKSIKKEMKNK